MQESHATSWTEEQIRKAWNQGQIAERSNPDMWRKDVCGAWVSRQEYGNKNSIYGWEIDNGNPPADGANDGSGLRPLQWKNAAARKEGKPTCAVIAYGGENVGLT
jgi:hypothetical protein